MSSAETLLTQLMTDTVSDSQRKPFCHYAPGWIILWHARVYLERGANDLTIFRHADCQGKSMAFAVQFPNLKQSRRKNA